MEHPKRIFFDLDETLIHTLFREPQDTNYVLYETEYSKYYSVIRPSAKHLIEYAREKVGKENVYVLTAATRDYAIKITNEAGFGFDPKNVFTREDLQAHSYKSGWGSEDSSTVAHGLASPNNYLIDNLPLYENGQKRAFLGITNRENNYLKVDDYYGYSLPEEEAYFEEDVKAFIDK